jgi:hypothetical protein
VLQWPADAALPASLTARHRSLDVAATLRAYRQCDSVVLLDVAGGNVLSGVSRDAVLELQRHAAHAITLLNATENGTITLVDAIDALFDARAPAIASYDVCTRVPQMPLLSALLRAASAVGTQVSHPSLVCFKCMRARACVCMCVCMFVHKLIAHIVVE